MRSRRGNESEVESSAVEKTLSKRLSKRKATSKISGNFEHLDITPPIDGSALVKAEIWEEIAGMQKNESGLMEGEMVAGELLGTVKVMRRKERKKRRKKLGVMNLKLVRRKQNLGQENEREKGE